MTLDWGSLIVGTVLAIPAGIVSIILKDYITSYLDRRKIVVSEKRRKKLLLQYHKIVEFRKNKEAFALFIASYSLVGVGGLISCSIPLLLLTILPTLDRAFHGDMTPPNYTMTSEVIILLLIVVDIILMYVSWFFIRDVIATINRYQSFEKFEMDLKTQFGSAALFGAVEDLNPPS
jgi:hypothetical protein